jgi:hypothetical protein
MTLKELLITYKEKLLTHWAEYTARLALTILTGIMSYVVLLPSYNFAHLIPHDLLDSIGVSYNSQLWFERHSDNFLHFGGAAILVLLLVFSNILSTTNQPKIALIVVTGLCIAAELAQLLIGRGFDEYDLLLGISGSFMAYFALARLIEKPQQN